MRKWFAKKRFNSIEKSPTRNTSRHRIAAVEEAPWNRRWRSYRQCWINVMNEEARWWAYGHSNNTNQIEFDYSFGASVESAITQWANEQPKKEANLRWECRRHVRLTQLARLNFRISLRLSFGRFRFLVHRMLVDCIWIESWCGLNASDLFGSQSPQPCPFRNRFESFWFSARSIESKSFRANPAGAVSQRTHLPHHDIRFDYIVSHFDLQEISIVLTNSDTNHHDNRAHHLSSTCLLIHRK